MDDGHARNGIGSRHAPTRATIDRAGVRWSLAGFVVVGGSGLLLNIIINDRYGSATLGRFNVLLALFIIGGQLGAVGIQSSVLFHTPRARSLGRPTGQVLVAALRVAVVSSSLCVLVVIGGGELLMRATGNDVYRTGLRAIAIGLFLYPSNKVLLSHLNGLRRIRAFAIIYASRYLLLLVVVVALITVDALGSTLPWAISIAEVVLVVVLVIVNRDELRSRARRGDDLHLGRQMLRFGIRGMSGGLLLDLNTRVDILILGALAGSRSVGRYSIASLFAEGLYQLAMVSRYSFDPVVAGLFVEERLAELRSMMRNGIRRVYLYVAPVGLISIVSYPVVARVLFGREIADDTWSIYALLALGVVLSAGYIPFTSLLQQTGHPTKQSYLLGWISATNVALNLAFVPFLGANGAALATAIAQVALVPYIRALARRTLGFAV